MESSTVLGLQRRRDYPSVSLLVPVEAGAKMTDADRVRVQRRIDDLARRLLGDVDPATTAQVMERLQVLLDDLADQPTRRSLALFASPSISFSHHLHVEVRERTVVDDSFATRDLLDEVRRTEVYLAATVSDRSVRLFDGSGDQLVPAADRGAPLDRQDGESEGSWDRRSAALLRGASTRGVPLVLFGDGQRVATLVRSGDLEPVAVVQGSHDRTPWSTLVDLARAPLADWSGSRNATALRRLDVARSRRLFAAGLDEIWALAKESRVDLLVVERNYAVPVRADGPHLVPVAADEIEAPDVVDDAVDDLIEAVALRRGDVAVVPDGILAAHGRVAAALRF